MKPFEHGGDLTAFAKHCGCAVSEVIDLSSNINPFARFRLPRIDPEEIAHYPEYSHLYGALAERYEVAAEQIELYNGGSSAIFSLFRTLNPSECVIYAPAYSEYKRAAQIHGCRLSLINRFENLTAPIGENALVIFVNPSTPDGRYYDMDELLAYWRSRNATVLVDESFLDFTDHPSLASKLGEYDNLHILKSMTKIYGCAGVRVGAILSSSNNISHLRESEPLWKLSALDQYYLLEVLKDTKLIEKTKRKTARNRDRLVRVLEKSKLFETIYPSEANFVMARLATMDAVTLQHLLEPYRIMIRNCENFDFLDERTVRIAVKKKDSIRKLKEALCSLR